MIRNLKTNRYIKYDTDYFHKLLKQNTKNNPIFKSSDLRKLRSMQKAGGDERDVCPVCHEVPYSKCLKLEPCSHFVCENCIQSWCDSFKDKPDICTCPMCREPITRPLHILIKSKPLRVKVTPCNSVITKFKQYFRNSSRNDAQFSYKNIYEHVYKKMKRTILLTLLNSISDPQNEKNAIKDIHLGGFINDANADLRAHKRFDFVLLIDYYSHHKALIDSIVEEMYKSKDNPFMYDDEKTKQHLWKATLIN